MRVSLYQVLTPIVALGMMTGGLGLEMIQARDEPKALSEPLPVRQRWSPVGLQGDPATASEGYLLPFVER